MKVYRILASGAGESDLEEARSNDLHRYIILTGAQELPAVAEAFPMPEDIVKTAGRGDVPPSAEDFGEMAYLTLLHMESKGRQLAARPIRLLLWKKLLVIVQDGMDKLLAPIFDELLGGFDNFMGAANVLEYVINRIIRLLRINDMQILQGWQTQLTKEIQGEEDSFASLRETQNAILRMANYLETLSIALETFADNPGGIMSATAARSMEAAAKRALTLKKTADMQGEMLGNIRSELQSGLLAESIEWSRKQLYFTIGGFGLIFLTMIIITVVIMRFTVV